MIIHSTAATALFTAAYLMVQSVIHPGADTAPKANEAPPGIEQAKADIVKPAQNIHKMRPLAKLAAVTKQETKKKVIVIGRNSVSVKYVTQ